jgi:hypothetical protein
MSRDEEEKSPRLFDNRTIERNIRKGLITRKDYDKYLKSLPDVTEKIAPADAPRSGGLVAGVDDDEDDLDKLDDDIDDDEDMADDTAEVKVAPGEAAADDEDDDDDDDMADDIDDEDDVDADDGNSGDEKPPTA